MVGAKHPYCAHQGRQSTDLGMLRPYVRNYPVASIGEVETCGQYHSRGLPTLSFGAGVLRKNGENQGIKCVLSF